MRGHLVCPHSATLSLPAQRWGWLLGGVGLGRTPWAGEALLLRLSHTCRLVASLLCPGMYPVAAAPQEAESSRKLTHILNAVTDALVWVISRSGIPPQQQSMRLANLLMLLSHVRHARYHSCGAAPPSVCVCGVGDMLRRG